MEQTTLDEKIVTLQDAVMQLQQIVSKLLDITAIAQEKVKTGTPTEPYHIITREGVEQYSGEKGEDVSEQVFNNAVRLFSEKYPNELEHLSFEWIRKNCL
jgi:hypothetical protein